jgi:hypothetical protein
MFYGQKVVSLNEITKLLFILKQIFSFELYLSLLVADFDVFRLNISEKKNTNVQHTYKLCTCQQCFFFRFFSSHRQHSMEAIRCQNSSLVDLFVNGQNTIVFLCM